MCLGTCYHASVGVSQAIILACFLCNVYENSFMALFSIVKSWLSENFKMEAIRREQKKKPIWREGRRKEEGKESCVGEEEVRVMEEEEREIKLHLLIRIKLSIVISYWFIDTRKLLSLKFEDIAIKK